MARTRSSGRVGLLAAFTAVFAPCAAACGQRLSGILPPECVATVDVENPGTAIETLLRAVGGLPADLPPEIRALAGAGLLAVRAQLDGPIDGFVERMARGGAAFGILREDSRWVPLLVLRPGNRDRAMEFVGRFPAVHCEAVEDLLLVSATAAGCDRLRAGLKRPAVTVDETPGLVRGRVDLRALRDVIPAPDGDEIDAGGRFFLAPMLSVLTDATRLDVSLTADDGVRLAARLDASVRGTVWAGLLAAGGEERAVAPLPEGGILQVALDRSLASLLRYPEKFLSEAGQLDVESFLSIADLLDGATTSFVDDLVGGLAEPMVLTVLEIDPAGDDHGDGPLRIPGIALSAPIGQPDVEAILRRAAGVFATIINGERAQNRKKPFVVRNAYSDHGVGLTTESPLWRGPGLPPLEDRLSPTLLFGQGHVVLASTHDAADRLLAALADRGPGSVRGDRMTLRGASAARAIAASRATLELGRILDEGETPSEAARFFDIVEAVANAIERLELTADYRSEATTLTLELESHR